MVGNNNPAPGQLNASHHCRWLASPEPADARLRSRVKVPNSNRNKARIEFPVTHSKQRTEVLSNRNRSRGAYRTTLRHFTSRLVTLSPSRREWRADLAGPRSAMPALQSSRSISQSCGLRTSTAGCQLVERSSERTPLSSVDRRTLPLCRSSWSSNRRTSRSPMHRPPSDLRSCTAPKDSRSRTQRLATRPLLKEFFSDSQCVPCSSRHSDSMRIRARPILFVSPGSLPTASST
jgi:hypothetical protein